VTSYEPYVADPAEPRGRARMAEALPAVAVAAAVLLVLGVLALWRLGDATQDPAVGETPAPAGGAPAD
jgi:hypothetical protein